MASTKMKRTSMVVAEDLLQLFKTSAAERGISMATLFREALEEKAATLRRPKPRSLGIGDSGHTNIARRIGEEGFVPEPWR